MPLGVPVPPFVAYSRTTRGFADPSMEELSQPHIVAGMQALVSGPTYQGQYVRDAQGRLGSCRLPS
jgi:hypothetical protein